MITNRVSVLSLKLLGVVCLIAVSLAVARLFYAHAYSYALDAHKRGDYALALPIVYAGAIFLYEPSYGLLGTMYLLGQGMRQDGSKAEYWLLKAAASNEVAAQSILGIMYATGQGAPKDLQKARHWLTAAAARGDAEALRMLRHVFGSGQI